MRADERPVDEGWVGFSVLLHTVPQSRSAGLALARHLSLPLFLYFPPVSRLHCESESFKMDLILDVNIQIYPVDLGKYWIQTIVGEFFCYFICSLPLEISIIFRWQVPIGHSQYLVWRWYPGWWWIQPHRWQTFQVREWWTGYLKYSWGLSRQVVWKDPYLIQGVNDYQQNLRNLSEIAAFKNSNNQVFIWSSGCMVVSCIFLMAEEMATEWPRLCGPCILGGSLVDGSLEPHWVQISALPLICWIS